MNLLSHSLTKVPREHRSGASCCDDAACATASGRLTSAQLLHDRRELEIVHNGCVYRLRVTATGKLILTK